MLYVYHKQLRVNFICFSKAPCINCMCQGIQTQKCWLYFKYIFCYIFVPERIDITACLETCKFDINCTFLLKNIFECHFQFKEKNFLAFISGNSLFHMIKKTHLYTLIQLSFQYSNVRDHSKTVCKLCFAYENIFLWRK